MKSSIRTVAIVVALAPAAAFAQTSMQQPQSHAQAMDQLTQLRQNGYTPSKIHYPADIQRAESRGSMNADNGYGGVSEPATQAGSPSAPTISRGTWHSMYGHH